MSKPNFDFNKPAFGTFARSVEVRQNFNALATCHAWETEPDTKVEGMLWYDTLQKQLKCYMNKNDGNGLRWVIIIDIDINVGNPISFENGLVIRTVSNETSDNIEQGDLVVWDNPETFTVKLNDTYGTAPVAGIAFSNVDAGQTGLLIVYGYAMAKVDGQPVEIYPNVYTNAISIGDELGASATPKYACKKGRTNYSFGVCLENTNIMNTVKIFVNCL